MNIDCGEFGRGVDSAKVVNDVRLYIARTLSEGKYIAEVCGSYALTD